WLKGLSPKQNRDIPPLNYGRVERLKARRGDLEIVLNGGIGSVEEAVAHLQVFDGVMLGRAAYQTPWLLGQVDEQVYGSPAPVSSPRDALAAFLPYVQETLADGARLNQIARHMLGLFQGRPGARAWRRHLSETMHMEGASAQTLLDAADAMEPLAA
ncbi:MAG: tRNA-dihydrouridine synthase, partial [Pseudomonadota bacterium]